MLPLKQDKYKKKKKTPCHLSEYLVWIVQFSNFHTGTIFFNITKYTFWHTQQLPKWLYYT